MNNNISIDELEKVVMAYDAMYNETNKVYHQVFEAIQKVNTLHTMHSVTNRVSRMKNEFDLNDAKSSLSLVNIEKTLLRKDIYYIIDNDNIADPSTLSRILLCIGFSGVTTSIIYEITKLIGAASTGVTISSLSGAASHNATLALLGGGALSIGGSGIAGGVQFLTSSGIIGIVVGVLLMFRDNIAVSNTQYNLEYINKAISIILDETSRLSTLKSRLSQGIDACNYHFDTAVSCLHDPSYSSGGCDDKINQSFYNCASAAEYLVNLSVTDAKRSLFNSI